VGNHDNICVVNGSSSLVENLYGGVQVECDSLVCIPSLKDVTPIIDSL